MAWGADDKCPRCGFERAEADCLLAFACREQAAARAAASEGRWEDVARHLAAAREAGLKHSASERLAALHAAVVGAWGHARDVPETWRAAMRNGAAARYDNALMAARAGDWGAALDGADAALAAAPFLLPARKLRLLCLAALGRGDEARDACRAFLNDVPGDADAARVLGALPEPGVPVRERDAARSPNPKGFPVWGAAALTALIFAPVAGLFGFQAGRSGMGGAASPSAAAASVLPSAPPAPAAAAAPAPKTPPVPAATRPAAPPPAPTTGIAAGMAALPDDLRREVERSSARLWLRQALRARRRGDHAEAVRRADAAAVAGRGTYVQAEALLAAAQSARDAGGADAPRRFARLASETPRSEYAPVGLYEAWRIATAAGRGAEAEGYAARMRAAYADSAAARRMTRRQRQQQGETARRGGTRRRGEGVRP